MDFKKKKREINLNQSERLGSTMYNQDAEAMRTVGN